MILSRDVKFLENKSWYGPTNESLSTSSKVSITSEEDEFVDQKNEGPTNIHDSRQRQKGKQPQTCRVSAPSSSR